MSRGARIVPWAFVSGVHVRDSHAPLVIIVFSAYLPSRWLYSIRCPLKIIFFILILNFSYYKSMMNICKLCIMIFV